MLIEIIKVGCVFPMVGVSLLPDAEFGSNDHREDAPHFNLRKIAVLGRNKTGFQS